MSIIKRLLVLLGYYMQKNAIIIGMPRSGTSMVTNIFAKNGYFLAENESDELRAGDEFNPSGYWEAKDLINANDEIFSAADYLPDNTWLYDPITEIQENNILELSEKVEHSKLVEKYNMHKPWVWKDPRLCYTIGYWWPLLNKEDTRVILLTRAPEEIYSSFVRLNWRANNQISKDDVIERVHRHLAAAKKAILKFDIPFIELDYSDFKLNPEVTSEKISRLFGLQLTANELLFNEKLNTSGLRGSLMKVANRIGDWLPDSLRKTIKKYTPLVILKIVFPHRYTK